MGGNAASATQRRRGSIGWREMGPGIARTAASAREKKPTAAKSVKAKPAAGKPATELKAAPPGPAVAAPPIKIKDRVLATFGDYSGLQHAIRARSDELGYTRAVLDHLSGCQEGMAGKILGAAQVKRFGKQSLGGILGAVGAYLTLLDDPAQREKLEALVEEVDKLKAVVAAMSALFALGDLGVTLSEFKCIATLVMPPKSSGIGSLGDLLAAASCRMALLEDEAQTAKMTARASARRSVRRSPVSSERSANVCS